MVTLLSRPRKTVEDFLKLPEGVRAELIEGEIFRSPSPKSRHQQIIQNIFRILDPFVRTQDLGQIWISPLDVHLPSGDVVEPDLIFVSSANRGIVRDWIRGVPDLLIEVILPDGAERDRIVKREVYARNRVLEYWIVDDLTRSVEVLRIGKDGYEPCGYFQASERVESPTFPSLSLPLTDVFARTPHASPNIDHEFCVGDRLQDDIGGHLHRQDHRAVGTRDRGIHMRAVGDLHHLHDPRGHMHGQVVRSSQLVASFLPGLQRIPHLDLRT